MIKLDGWIGDGKKYDSLQRDWEGTEEHFGFFPYKGTLNVAIRPQIEPSENDNTIQPFKDFICYKGEIEGINAWFCYSKYRKRDIVSTFYVVSEIRLRDKISDKKVNITINKEI